MPLSHVLLAALRLALPATDTTAGVFRRVDAAISEYMAQGHIPGMSVAIARGGKVVHARGFGWADLENRVPVSEVTVFPTASVLKLLTAVAVLQLAERGKLDLDGPVETWCPSFPAKRWPVTPRRLLAHQAGIRPSRGSDVFNRDHFATVRDAVARFADDSLRYEPGTAVVYSNEGYVLLACAIEGASGQSYDEYIRRAILEPAGMTHTFPEDVYRVMPHISRSYMVRTAANTKAWEGLWTATHLSATQLDVPAPADPLDPSLFPGAGNYRSTPTDMARFVLALTRGTLLSDSMRVLLFQEVDAAGQPSGRSLGDWMLSREGADPVARVLGSVWSGSFAVVTVPGRRVTVTLASNVEFNQPAELMQRIVGMLVSR